METVHGNIKEHICQQCNFSSNNMRDLNRHIESIHHNAKNIKSGIYKKKVKEYLNKETETEHAKKVKELIKQGKMLELAKKQQQDLTWKSYIFNLKKGTLKFVLNATMDTLPTNANLNQWGKTQTDKCKN